MATSTLAISRLSRNSSPAVNWKTVGEEPNEEIRNLILTTNHETLVRLMNLFPSWFTTSDDLTTFNKVPKSVLLERVRQLDVEEGYVKNVPELLHDTMSQALEDLGIPLYETLDGNNRLHRKKMRDVMKQLHGQKYELGVQVILDHRHLSVVVCSMQGKDPEQGEILKKIPPKVDRALIILIETQFLDMTK